MSTGGMGAGGMGAGGMSTGGMGAGGITGGATGGAVGGAGGNLSNFSIIVLPFCTWIEILKTCFLLTSCLL